MKRAQLSQPMNWILILFAGAFFLLLFISITKVMLDAGEGRSEATTLKAVTNVLEKTKLNPDTRINVTLPEITTSCENNFFHLRTKNQERTFSTHALFAPPVLEGKTTIWSEEFKIVNPITTLTYFFPRNTLYVLIDSVPESIAKELYLLPHKKTKLSDLFTTDLQGYPHIIVVGADSSTGGASLTGKKIALERNQEASGISFDGTNIQFYNYIDKFIADANHPYADKGFLYGAIAAGTSTGYECGVAVAETHTKFITQINLNRTKIIRNAMLLTSAVPTKCKDAYNSARGAYDIIKDDGLAAVRTQTPVLKRASKILGNNGCPNI